MLERSSDIDVETYYFIHRETGQVLTFFEADDLYGKIPIPEEVRAFYLKKHQLIILFSAVVME